MSKDTRIFVKGTGAEAGQLEGDVLRIVKKSPFHFVRKYSGFGVSPETLTEAESEGATRLEIVAPDCEIFRCTIKEYRAAAIRDDLGYGPQLFISRKSLRYYTKHEPAYRNEPVQIG